MAKKYRSSAKENGQHPKTSFWAKEVEMTKKEERQRQIIRRLLERDDINLKDFDVDEALEQLDQGSPKLNWFYVILALLAIFGFAYAIIEFAPRNDLPQTSNFEEVTEQIKEQNKTIEKLEEKTEELEERLDELEERS